MSTQYKFEQVSTIVSGKFDEIRSKCEKLGIGKEHILDLFLRSRIKKVTEEDDSLWGSISEINVKMHSAAPNGSWCGDQRQLSAANGTLN